MEARKGDWRNPLTEKNVKRIGSQIAEALGGILVSDLTPKAAECVYRAFNLPSLSTAYLRYRRAWFFAFVLWAIRRKFLPRDRYFEIQETWPAKTRVVRSVRTMQHLSVDEEEALSAALLEWERPALERYVRFAIRTGFRRSTIYALLWRMVREDESGWFIEVPGECLKNGEPLKYPVNARLREIMGERKAELAPLLPELPPKSQINDYLKRAGKKAGLECWKNLRTHQLRCTWVKRCKDAGITLEQIQLLQNWKSKSVLLRHYYPDQDLGEKRSLLKW